MLMPVSYGARPIDSHRQRNGLIWTETPILYFRLLYVGLLSYGRLAYTYFLTFTIVCVSLIEKLQSNTTRFLRHEIYNSLPITWNHPCALVRKMTKHISHNGCLHLHVFMIRVRAFIHDSQLYPLPCTSLRSKYRIPTKKWNTKQ